MLTVSGVKFFYGKSLPSRFPRELVRKLIIVTAGTIIVTAVGTRGPLSVLVRR